jgi:hypothetical protein
VGLFSVRTLFFFSGGHAKNSAPIFNFSRQKNADVWNLYHPAVVLIAVNGTPNARAAGPLLLRNPKTFGNGYWFI